MHLEEQRKNMRAGLHSVVLFVAIGIGVHGSADAKAPNEYIDISVKVEKDSLKAGSEGRLLFSLKPKTGFHVNVEPPISIELTGNKGFSLLTKKFTPDSTVKPLTSKDGYKIFNPSAPVKFAFKIAKSAKPGTHIVQAKLTYYYCSDAEGWCSFTTESFPVKITVVAPR
jgi:hypothetical protein